MAIFSIKTILYISPGDDSMIDEEEFTEEISHRIHNCQNCGSRGKLKKVKKKLLCPNCLEKVIKKSKSKKYHNKK